MTAIEAALVHGKSLEVDPDDPRGESCHLWCMTISLTRRRFLKGKACEIADSGTHCCNIACSKCLVAIALDESVPRHKDASQSYLFVCLKVAPGSAIPL